MKIPTTRFGELDMPDEEIYSFPEGLLGFADVRKFILLQNPKGGPIHWLQAAEVPSLAFVVADPTLFFSDYRVGVRAEEMSSIHLDDLANGVVRVILTVPKDPKEITANLQGPLILNPQKRLGRQIVVTDAKLSTREKIFKKETKESEPETGK